MKTFSKVSVLGAATLILAACDSSAPLTPVPGINLGVYPTNPPTAVTPPQVPGSPVLSDVPKETLTVCKYGTDGSFDYTWVDNDNTSNTGGDSFTLSDGTCAQVLVADFGGADFTVTENLGALPAGGQLDSIVVTTSQSGALSQARPAGSSASGTIDGGSDGLGVMVEFFNSIVPTGDGRFTGGGSFFLGDVRFTHGFELRCDASDHRQNLEINWLGNQFHLEQLTSAVCLWAADPKPPQADVNTYIGTGVGRLNGVPGAQIEFTITDAGEPGTKDTMTIMITPASGPVIIVPTTFLKKGNHQAHKATP